MKTRSFPRLGSLVIGVLTTCVAVRAQEFEVDVKFVETRGWDRLAASSEDWSAHVNRRGVRMLGTPRIITQNGQRAGVRLESPTTRGVGVGAVVTPSLTRGGIRLEGQAAALVPIGLVSKRQGARPAVETVTSAFNRTVAPGQYVTIHLGRRWEVQTIEDWSSRTARTQRVNVPFDYYVCLAAGRAQ